MVMVISSALPRMQLGLHLITVEGRIVIIDFCLALTITEASFHESLPHGTKFLLTSRVKVEESSKILSYTQYSNVLWMRKLSIHVSLSFFHLYVLDYTNQSESYWLTDSWDLYRIRQRQNQFCKEALSKSLGNCTI